MFNDNSSTRSHKRFLLFLLYFFYVFFFILIYIVYLCILYFIKQKQIAEGKGLTLHLLSCL